MTAAACRTCGEPLEWAVTAGGKRMPVDYDPHPEGNVLLRRRSDGSLTADVLAGERLDHARSLNATLWRSHFATCAQAELWRTRA